jgi:hypothetical protein
MLRWPRGSISIRTERIVDVSSPSLKLDCSNKYNWFGSIEIFEPTKDEFNDAVSVLANFDTVDVNPRPAFLYNHQLAMTDDFLLIVGIDGIDKKLRVKDLRIKIM